MMQEYNHSLLTYNTFGIDVNANCIVEYDSVADLLYFLEEERTKHPEWPLLHIGAGSNLLFLGDWHGYVLRSNITGVEVLEQDEDTVVVRVGAGIEHDAFVNYSIQQGWYGLENLSLIPGQVGAAAVQNIGAYGVEAALYIYKVEAVDMQNGSQRVFMGDECRYAYRYSIFKDELKGRYAITYVAFRLNRHFMPCVAYGGISKALEERGYELSHVTAEQLREVIIDLRQSKLPDPKELGNAGSFFMNPVVTNAVYEKLLKNYPTIPHYTVDNEHVKVPAGWLIEQAGWKGRALGKAAVHDKQALVLVNKGGAQGKDIVALCDAVCKDVQERFGISLMPEVNFIGGDRS